MGNERCLHGIRWCRNAIVIYKSKVIIVPHNYQFILFYFVFNCKMLLNQVAARNSIINQYLENTDLSLFSISKKLKLPY